MKKIFDAFYRRIKRGIIFSAAGENFFNMLLFFFRVFHQHADNANNRIRERHYCSAISGDLAAAAPNPEAREMTGAVPPTASRPAYTPIRKYIKKYKFSN